MIAGENDDDMVIDPGLQCERTRLAWDRTALSFSAFGALLVHSGHGLTRPAVLVLGIAVVCCGLAIYVLGRRRYRRLVTALHGGDTAPRPRALAVVGALTTVTAIVSGLDAVLSH
jgi:uncharacterized membrane protein YidH (DUF202 family)